MIHYIYHRSYKYGLYSILDARHQDSFCQTVRQAEDYTMLGSDKAIIGAIAIIILGIVVSVALG
jgi:hypothetical protein